MAQQKQSKKVLSIEDSKKAAHDADIGAFLDVMSKDDPSPEARARYDALLDSKPDEWRSLGDLSREALEQGLKGFWLGYATKASVMRGAEVLKAELGFEDATPVVRMMIEHAVVCHVRLGMVEHYYSRNGTSRMDVAEHWERRLTLAQKRFTRAMLTLAKVRVLLARAEAAEESASRARSARSLGILKAMAG